MNQGKRVHCWHARYMLNPAGNVTFSTLYTTRRYTRQRRWPNHMGVSHQPCRHQQRAKLWGAARQFRQMAWTRPSVDCSANVNVLMG